MPTPGQELSSIDFESMIGGPLTAVVNAQAQAAMSTVNFVKEVGFNKSTQTSQAGGNSSTMEPIYVSFRYPKEISPYVPAVPANPGNPTATPPVAATPAVDAKPAVFETQRLDVPILTMLPIPFIRIAETTIDFNAKINSVEYRKTDSSLDVSAGLEGSAGWLFGSVKLKVNTAYKRTTQEGNTVDRNYSMAVHVRAVQDEMPAGMEKLLGILEGAIVSQPNKDTKVPSGNP